MAYSEFSIESALSVPRAPRSVKLQGVYKGIRAINSSSRSTEEFIQGAISALGNADRCVMYVHSSLEALHDRLVTAKRIADPINLSKARGVEGFERVPKLDPWAYALEESEADGGFFKKMLDAVATACRRVIEAIMHVIKWIGNAVASLDSRQQAKDYKLYMANKSTVTKYIKANKTLKTKFNSLDWSIKSAQDFATFVKKAAGTYGKMAKDKGGDIKIIENMARGSGAIKNNNKDMRAQYGELFKKWFDIPIIGTGANTSAKHAVEKINKLTTQMRAAISGDIGSVFGHNGKSETRSAHDLVMGYLTHNGGKTVEMTVEKMMKISSDFACLQDTWLSSNVTSVVSTVREQQKQFTQYTKNIDQVVSIFAKSNATKDNDMKSIGNAVARMANARVLYNSFWTGLILEIESAAIRYRKSSHIALKHCLRAAKMGPQKKSNESLSRYDVERMFDF